METIINIFKTILCWIGIHQLEGGIWNGYEWCDRCGKYINIKK